MKNEEILNQIKEAAFYDELEKIYGIEKNAFAPIPFLKPIGTGIAKAIGPNTAAVGGSLSHHAGEFGQAIRGVRLGGGAFSRFPKLNLIKGQKKTFSGVAKGVLNDQTLQGSAGEIGSRALKATEIFS